MTANLLAGVDAVIFDFDGVVIDSEPISLGELGVTLSQFGLEMSWPELVTSFMGHSDIAIQAYIEEKIGKPTGDLFPDAWRKRVREGFAKSLPVVDGIPALFERLDRDGIPHCLATGSSQARVAFALEQIGETERFADTAFSAEQVKNGKPAPDLFLFAADQLGVDPARSMVIEDGLAGVAGSKAAGIGLIVGFVGASHLNDDALRKAHAENLREAGATHIIESISDLL
ncbi:haloacid dehalogenase superfamily, subfamily IA, variant 3 with third motif having DD or ED [Cohaesibacter sp. ES.047]|uniref:HAD family hydrolase n=1 Tax=Cohaesibacter sp. ES.047 TaxID=1798205 RepID=UPI000BBF7B5F|nr:HAD family phosphatase [Cohaesibacter sp. ES.047]SNY90037.1 haloacid dehalogenase superfamily, subfamily IA, variant 3 with third motif having DD or ED [Cohaesibacter sp. ES.047]